MSLPGADELFRTTIADDETPAPSPPASTEPADTGSAATEPAGADAERPDSGRAEHVPETPAAADARTTARQASGRVKHDEKMTVYVTADELLDIEQARLSLRRALGTAVDRGRLVRAAVAIALADLDSRGDDSELVRRLGGE